MSLGLHNGAQYAESRVVAQRVETALRSLAITRDVTKVLCVRSNGDSLEESTVTLVSSCCGVDHGSVVPHRQHIFGPMVTVYKFFLGLMLVQEEEEFLPFRVIHSLDANRVARTEEERRAASFRMELHERMILRG